jgi:hypothetical protein
MTPVTSVGSTGSELCSISTTKHFLVSGDKLVIIASNNYRGVGRVIVQAIKNGPLFLDFSPRSL